MNANLDKIAQELYGKIQTRFAAIKIGDEQANVLSKKEDIPKARFFEFEYVEGGVPLGTVAITLDPVDGIVLQVSGDLVNDNNDTSNKGAFKFIRSFRQFAKDRLLKFDIQNIGKSNLDKRDYQFQAKSKEPTIMENKLFGTSRISYQNLGEARLIIKHNQHINPNLPAGRTMHIESIYIENIEGERFKYPFKHLNGARALAEHIKHGGTPYDGIGKHITSLSEELAHLRKFKGYVTRQPMISEAMGSVTDRVIERIQEVKKEIQHLQKSNYYETFAESFEEREEQVIPEDIINDLVDRLTIRTFNEELKAVFPYIYKLVDESGIPVREIDPSDILDEEARCPDCYNDPCECSDYDDDMIRSEGYDPEIAYESFMEDIVREDKNELFSPNKSAKIRAINKLNQILSTELIGGPNGINAIESLRGLIDSPELLDTIRNTDPDLDVRPLIQQYLTSNPDLFPNNSAETLALIQFGGDGEEPPMSEPAGGAQLPAEMPPAEEPPMAEPPMAEPPMAEPEVGAQPPAEMPPMAEPIAECGMSTSMSSGLNEMLKFVSGFYNRENKNFPLGGTRIKIKLKKDFEDGVFPNANPQDLIKVLKFIDIKDQGQVQIQNQPSVDLQIDPKEIELSELMTDIKRLAGI